MQAREFMTKDPVTVSPDTPTPEIARLLVAHGISAVPVVDDGGSPVGMVSEGDLLGRVEVDREARRDWWLMLLAEGEALHPDFLATLRKPQLTARAVMSAPVIRITETTEVSEIARLLEEYRIKRVPVVRDDRIVGIVSRADLLRVLAAEHPAQRRSEPSSRRPGVVGEIIRAIDTRFGHKNAAVASGAPHEVLPAATEAGPTVTDFRALAADFEHHNVEHREEARRSAAEQRRDRVKDLIDHHIADESWRALLHHAHDAAAHGGKELLLLRFPADLCTDRGRAINTPLPDWPRTLRGEAAEIYLRWERDLRPGGFHLAARVLNFPGGMPGDIGLFLVWDD
jgi:CBS domain-containing protein